MATFFVAACCVMDSRQTCSRVGGEAYGNDISKFCSHSVFSIAMAKASKITLKFLSLPVFSYLICKLGDSNIDRSYAVQTGPV